MRNRLRQLLMFVALLVISSCAAIANDWDERLEGTLPLPASYTYEVADPNSGISSMTADTGEIVLHFIDSSSTLRQGRINRGNWSSVNGVTLHTRFRMFFGAAQWGFQLNDGLSGGRFSMNWASGQMTITTGTPDSGQPSSLSVPANTWVEIWVKILSGRYYLYTNTGGTWSLYSSGTASATSGAVYLGGNNTSGTGAMDFDFWRLETTGAYSPGDANAPSILPVANLPVGVTTNPILVGQSTNITVGGSELGTSYQLRIGTTNVGAPVTGTGGTINLPTGALSATTTFNVLARNIANPSSQVQLTQTRTVTVATPVSSIAGVKAMSDGSVIQISGKQVSAFLPSAYWLQETDRSSGIRVNSTLAPTTGTPVTVIGTLSTVGGERILTPITEAKGTPVTAPKPVYMSCADLGGAALNSITPGVEGAEGPNNIGLLVRVSGKVTALGGTYYYIDDGSNLLDGTSTNSVPNVGIRVQAVPSGLALGDHVKVTGVSTCFADGGSKLRRAVMPVSSGCTLPRSDLAINAVLSAVCYGNGTSITVSGSEIGVAYQLRNNADNSPVGGPVQGTGGVISLNTGAIYATTTYNVLATRTAGGCAVQMSTIKTISISSVPLANLTVGALSSSLAFNKSTSITVAQSEPGVNYQLRYGTVNVGNPVPGNGGTIQLPTGSLVATITFNVLATNASGCYTQLTQTKTITVAPVSTTSRVGLHIVIGSRNGYGPFLQQCASAGHPVAMIKAVDDMSPCQEAKQYSSKTLTVGRFCYYNGVDYNNLGSYSGTPQEAANQIYPIMKAKWQQYPFIDVWEICNEWDSHYQWQADYYIAMMDKAEADGYKLAIWSSSGGTPSELVYDHVVRTCQRAKRSGGHMLALHEYGFWEDDLLMHNPTSLVTRYRRLYDVLAQNNAVVPLVLTETGQGGGYEFVGTNLFIQDYTWYDAEMKKDPYVIGCAAWTLGNWSNANCQDALPALGNYISTH